MSKPDLVMCLMGPELAITTRQQNLRAELSCFCETIRSVLGRGQKKQIEWEELLGWEHGKEETSCPMQVPGVPASQTWCVGTGQGGKRHPASVQQAAM